MTEHFEVVDQGFVVRGPLSACSRVAVIDGRELVCTYVTTAVRSGGGGVPNVWYRAKHTFASLPLYHRMMSLQWTP